MYIDGIEVANPLLVTQLESRCGGPRRGDSRPTGLGALRLGRDQRRDQRHHASRRHSALRRARAREQSGRRERERLRHESRPDARSAALACAAAPTSRSAGLSLEFGQTGAVFPSAQSRQLSILGDGRRVTSNATLQRHRATVRSTRRRRQQPAARRSSARRGWTPSGSSSGPGGSGGPGGGGYDDRRVAPVAAARRRSARAPLHRSAAARRSRRMACGRTRWSPASTAISSTTSPTRRIPSTMASMPRVAARRAAAIARRCARAASRSSAAQSAIPATTLTLSVEHSVLRQRSNVTDVVAPVGRPALRDGRRRHDARSGTTTAARSCRRVPRGAMRCS